MVPDLTKAQTGLWLLTQAPAERVIQASRPGASTRCPVVPLVTYAYRMVAMKCAGLLVSGYEELSSSCVDIPSLVPGLRR